MKLKYAFSKLLILLCLSGFICAEVNAATEFSSESDNNMGDHKVVSDNSCDDYILVAPNCEGKECEEGWICGSCSSSDGTHYKCEQAKTPDGYIAGVTACEPCSEYFHNGFTGNLINGRCIQIKDCSTDKNNKYTSFKYINGIKVGDGEITYLEKTGYKKKAR